MTIENGLLPLAAVIALWGFIALGIVYRYRTFPRFCEDCGKPLEARVYAAGYDKRTGRLLTDHFYACPDYPNATPEMAEWSNRYERCRGRFRRSVSGTSNQTITPPPIDRRLIE